MEILKDKINNIITFKLRGRLDSNSFLEFEKEIFNEIEIGSCYFILNLERVDYMSSAGLRTILKVTKSLNEIAGKLVICSIPEKINAIFEISGFSFFLKIAPNLEEAIKEFD
jgi:anti-sigma B factor antagonist